ncbi:expressed protein [Echinococcus multilocularis]|uniref:Expressed protein n=1 Tax=Echinococcus multilocularis TaxID=6211 RepID=A0A068YIM0_ECHMU|nr:expressed protein [Echinococcus multilocularis]
MAKKEKKPKEKKEKKGKKDKKDKKDKKSDKSKSSSSDKKVTRKTERLEVSICGHPDVVDMYMLKSSDLNAVIDSYQIDIDPDPGTNTEGQVIDKEADLFLCVYDVRNRKTVDFLRSRVLPEVKNLNKKMAIAGLGLEYRMGGREDLADMGTASSLAKQYGCRGAELVYCEGEQLAAGTFSLYAASNPEKYNKDTEEKTEEEGGKKKGKDKKDKKGKKDKKDKKEKKKKEKKKK